MKRIAHIQPSRVPSRRCAAIDRCRWQPECHGSVRSRRSRLRLHRGGPDAPATTYRVRHTARGTAARPGRAQPGSPWILSDFNESNPAAFLSRFHCNLTGAQRGAGVSGAVTGSVIRGQQDPRCHRGQQLGQVELSPRRAMERRCGDVEEPGTPHEVRAQHAGRAAPVEGGR